MNEATDAVAVTLSRQEQRRSRGESRLSATSGDWERYECLPLPSACLPARVPSLQLATARLDSLAHCTGR